jgi:hypothetical protein
VEPMAAVPAGPGLPPVMMVETGFGFPAPAQKVAVPSIVAAPEGVELAAVAVDVAPALAIAADLTAPAAEAAADTGPAGWESEELFQAFAARVGRTARDG